MHFDNWLIPLQFFAEGAAAGDGGEGPTADSAVNAGQQGDTLESLGIPKHKLERYNRVRMNRASSQEAEAEAPAEGEKAAESTPTQTAKVTFEDILKDPEENAKVQDMVKNRLKKHYSELEQRKKYDDVLNYIAAKAGIKDFNVESADPQALLAAVEGDSSYFEDEAFAKGISTEELMSTKKQERLNREQTRMQVRAHYSTLKNQADALKKSYPEFDLETELQNPRFFNLTSLAAGASVEDAYRAIHFDELLEARVSAAVREAVESVTRSVRAGRTMPVENGTDGRYSGPIPDKLYSQMSPEERAEFYRQMTGHRLSRR